MKKLIAIVLLATLLDACNKRNSLHNDLLLPSNIKSQVFSINPAKDTILKTSHATVLRIKKGTFKSIDPVSIEIKEIFTPGEILLSGLTTTSDGKPLRSAGMLYFNASVDGDDISPQLPIETTIPAKDPDPEMQVFKGEMNDDSTVNWIEPQDIDTTRPGELIATGKTLFGGKCASCHKIFTDITGPSLKDLQYRGPWKNPKNILSWLHNPAKFMSKDKYTQHLKSKYGSMMTAFPGLTENDVISILAYINSAKQDEQFPDTAKKQDTTGKGNLALPDCGSDTSYISVQDSLPEYDTTSYPDILPDTSYQQDNQYDDRNIYNEGYDFNITGNGWYNVDAFLKTGSKDILDVKLTVELVMREDIYMNVYVFVPSERIIQATYHKKGNQYYFDLENDSISLPFRYRAIIFAFGSYKDKILYGVSEFTVDKEQIIPVEIKETTKEGLKNLLYAKNLNGVEIESIEKKIQINKIPCDQITDYPKDTIGIKKE